MKKLWNRIKAWLVNKLGCVDRKYYISVMEERLRLRERVAKISANLYDAERQIRELEDQLRNCNPTKVIEYREVHANIVPVKCVHNIPFALYAEHKMDMMDDLKKKMAKDIGLYLLELGLIDFKTRVDSYYPLQQEGEMEMRGVVYVKKDK